MDIAGWDEMYRTGERGAEDAPTILIKEATRSRAPGRGLDLACGTGRNALYLAENGWTVTAIDGSANAIEQLRLRAESRGLSLDVKVADLTAADFTLPQDAFDLILIAFYWQRSLFAKAQAATRQGGLIVAIAHTPDPGELENSKRAAPGELLTFFEDWNVLWNYEGPSRDPAHRRPVAEIVAQRVE